MTRQQAVLLVHLLLPGVLLSEAAKILAISSFGGSHYMLIDRISEILQDHGHQVTNFVRPFITGLKDKKNSYQVISWFPPEEPLQDFQKHCHFMFKESLQGRDNHRNIEKIFEYHGTFCGHLLSRRDIMESLKSENFDLLLFDGFDFCSFLIAEKLEKPFVAFLSTQLGSAEIGVPSPMSYVPVFNSLLTDRMNFWGRVKNFLMFFVLSIYQRPMYSQFDKIIQDHFAEGSRPDLFHLLQKAELWFVNSDFAFEFARPLLPNTVFVGGILDKPVKPIPEDLENFIDKFTDSGFVLVALGSILSMNHNIQVLKEMNSAFAHLPQGVIWAFKQSDWPGDVQLSKNVKIVDWIPQNDLLAHPSIRLFVTHGGINSIMEAIQHGVPIVGIPIIADQPENMVRIEAKRIGVSVQLLKLKAETFALIMKNVMEDKRYKAAAMAARAIRRSHPLTPAQRLVGWIDHILQTGGAAHLKPYAFQQTWYETYMLDVILFLLALTLVTLWLCWKLIAMLNRLLRRPKKLKKT